MRDKIIKLLIFILPLIVWIIWNVYWISENYDYSANDVVAHLLGERDVYSRISSEFRYNGIVNGIKLILHIPREELNWPRMTYLLSAILERIFNSKMHGVFYSNFFFSLIIIFSVSFIAYNISGFWGTFYSLLILLTIPAFIGHTRLYGLDLPLGSFFILTIALLILVKNKMTITRLLLLGIVMGIGVLIRPQYLLYISLPLATMMVMILIDNGLKKTLGLLLPVSLCGLSFIYWLTENINKVYKAYNELLVHIARDYYYKDIIFPYETGLSPFSIDWFFYYPRVFLINFGIFNSAILFISVVLIIRSFAKTRKIHSNISLLIISSLWLYIVFTVMSSKVPRYLFPVYPLVAIISGCGISLYANKILKNVVVIMLVFSLSFSVLMSHNESFEIAIKDLLYKKMKPASEVWLSVPRGEKGIEVFKSVSDILIRYSSQKPYPSVNISTNYSLKEMEFPIQVFYGNFVVNLRNNLLPWLSYHIEDMREFYSNFYRSKAMFPIYAPPIANSQVWCFTDILVVISDKYDIAVDDLIEDQYCPHKLIYKSLVRSYSRDWQDITVSVFTVEVE